MSITRPRAAQLLLAAVVVAMFLPWATSDLSLFDDSQGIEVNEGVLVMVVALITIVLVQLGMRPGWMGAGLVVAVTGREILDLRDFAGASVGIGLWIGFAGALVATGLLVLDMFAGIDRTPEADTD